MLVLSTLRESDRADFTAALSEARDWPDWDHELQMKANYIIKTVAGYYKTTCCSLEGTIWEWYENLKAHCGKATANEREDARRAYKTALLPLKNIKNAVRWLADWEIAISKAEQKGVLKAQISSTYALTRANDIRNGTLKYCDLINDFRIVVTRTTTRYRATKGAFGAQYNGERSEEDDTSQKNKKNKTKHKRKARGVLQEEDTKKCPACG
ncbi:hypothetical protein NPX13_g2261 [Xylaria arbuscula]|uniref:Uncharacterized protein n=1 Tax=Xylaria arbuscula TaxID=114810 RepID=A0A9W8TPC0_9PEZI|nr:hypothetical protein NPX13_g2261 [Xylaria arbuscula]